MYIEPSLFCKIVILKEVGGMLQVIFNDISYFAKSISQPIGIELIKYELEMSGNITVWSEL